MAKNNFQSWDATANNNEDVGGINIKEGCPPSGINNALREIMAQLKAGVDGEVVYSTKSGAYTALATDNNGVIECTTALTLSLTAAAMLGANWHAWVYANGGDVTVDPNASELINGASTLSLPNGFSALIICTGASFKAIVVRGAPPYAAKTGNYTAVASDNGGVLRFTTAATLSLTAAATLGPGYRLKVIAYGVDVTIDPNASEQINGAATFILKSGQTADIVCDGSAFWADVHGNSLSNVFRIIDSTDQTKLLAFDVSGIPTATTKTLKLDNIAKFAILQDQKASGTAGGSSVASAWTTRVLNTEVVDADSIVTLSSNQFTPTIDCLCRAESPFFQAGNTKLRIWNVTDSVEVARGPVVAAASGNNGSSFPSVVGKLLAGKTYRLEYYCTTATATNGLGSSTGDGGVEVFAQVFLQGLAA